MVHGCINTISHFCFVPKQLHSASPTTSYLAPEIRYTQHNKFNVFVHQILRNLDFGRCVIHTMMHYYYEFHCAVSVSVRAIISTSSSSTFGVYLRSDIQNAEYSIMSYVNGIPSIRPRSSMSFCCIHCKCTFYASMHTQWIFWAIVGIDRKFSKLKFQNVEYFVLRKSIKLCLSIMKIATPKDKTIFIIIPSKIYFNNLQSESKILLFSSRMNRQKNLFPAVVTCGIVVKTEYLTGINTGVSSIFRTSHNNNKCTKISSHAAASIWVRTRGDEATTVLVGE